MVETKKGGKMMRTRMMILAMVFLAILLVLPIFVLVESWNEDLANLGQQGTPLDDTGIQSYFNDVSARHQTLLTILAIGEITMLVLFVLAFRAGLKSGNSTLEKK
jgi:hypothetical protein